MCAQSADKWYNTQKQADKGNEKRARPMTSTDGSKGPGRGLKFFLETVGYPDRAPEGSVSFALRVDGREVLADEREGRIVLSSVLTADESQLPQLAKYAAGRMLREDAVLAWGGKAFLWQDAPANADSGAMARLFECFMDSCDWWRERVDALQGREAPSTDVAETMMIRP